MPGNKTSNDFIKRIQALQKHITEQQTALLTFDPPTNDDEENIDALLERLDKQMKETYRIADKYNLAGNQNVTLGDNLVTAIENALQNISDAINQIDTALDNIIHPVSASASASVPASVPASRTDETGNDFNY